MRSSSNMRRVILESVSAALQSKDSVGTAINHEEVGAPTSAKVQFDISSQSVNGNIKL